MEIHFPEFNTLVTFLGMLCASVQIVTGGWAAYRVRRPALLRTDDTLFRSHRAFGSFATVLFLLGLFAGLNGFVGAVRFNKPPLELDSLSFNVHTWLSFPVLVFFVWKTWLSYFDKKPLYTRRAWLGPALFGTWAFTWLSAAVSYYVRTLPSNPQHPPPTFLLPYEWLGVQLALPFVLGGAIGILTLRRSKAFGPPAATEAGSSTGRS